MADGRMGLGSNGDAKTFGMGRSTVSDALSIVEPGGDAAQIRQYELDYVLHPWLSQSDWSPIIVSRAKGNYFWDTEDKRYLDFTSQFVFSNIGHGDERVNRAITEQLARLPAVASPFGSSPRALLARRLAEVMPGDLGRTFFATSGAEANEAAIKIARAVTGRRKIISRYNSYHGSTYGAMALSRDPRSWPFDPSIPDVLYALPYYPYRCSLCGGSCTNACADQIEDIIRYNGPHNVAAVMIEAITGVNGVLVPSTDYLQRIRAMCDRYEILLIVDEVMTGFGRTGKWFAVDHWGVVPDIITVAKGLTSGYVPLSATIVREAIASYFDDHPLTHGHTYSGHPLACAAGIATLQVYQEDGLIERSAEHGEHLIQCARQLSRRHPAVGDVRGLGLFATLELVRNRENREPLGGPYDPSGSAVKKELLKKAFLKGLYIMTGMGNTVMLAPPLTITIDEIDWAMEVLDDVLETADDAYDA